MRVSSTGINNSIGVKNNKKVQDNPSFGRQQYKRVFSEFFNTGHLYSNSVNYEILMRRAITSKGAILDKFINSYIPVDRYYDLMYSFRAKKPVYETISENSYFKPTWLVKNGNDVLVSVVNLGNHGNFFDNLFGNPPENTRICFHGIDEYKNYVLCLGQDKNNKDDRILTRDGIGNLISAIKLQNL